MATVLLVSVATAAACVADDLGVLEQRLLADAADGALDDFSLLEGALVASGVTTREQIERYCSEFADRVEAMESASSNDSKAISDAERVYEFLHSEFLTGAYHSTCTELDRALDDGDYNCVTATILYHCLCRVHGMSPVAVATNTHVRSRFITVNSLVIDVEDKAFDVETTCREWFDVARRDPRALALRIQQHETRPLSDVELVAKIYYNRGVSLLETKAFAKALELLRLSQSLDPADMPTRENMAAGMNNWALAECDAGNFERAVELIQEGWAAHPAFAAFSANDVHIHQRWAITLCDKGEFAEAMQALQAAYLRRPEVALFARGRYVVFGQWACALLENGNLEDTSRLFREAEAWFDESAEFARYRSLAIQTVTRRLAHSGRDDEAKRLSLWVAELERRDSGPETATSDLTTANL